MNNECKQTFLLDESSKRRIFRPDAARNGVHARLAVDGDARADEDHVGEAAYNGKQDHHPDVMLSYGRVVIELWTHTVGGLSENDFICAARFDRANV